MRRGLTTATFTTFCKIHSDFEIWSEEVLESVVLTIRNQDQVEGLALTDAALHVPLVGFEALEVYKRYRTTLVSYSVLSEKATIYWQAKVSEHLDEVVKTLDGKT